VIWPNRRRFARLISRLSEQKAAHGDVDHVLGYVEALFVVAHQAPHLVIQPKVRSTTQRRGSTLKPSS
jgi:hypothetical protein